MAYQDSPKTEEDRQELLASSAHSDASSMDEEKQWGPSSTARTRAARWTNSQGRTFMSALREYAWLVTIGLMAVIVVLQLAIWHEVRGQSTSSISTATTPGGDYTGKGPTCKSTGQHLTCQHSIKQELSAFNFVQKKEKLRGTKNIIITVPTEVIKWNADPEFTPLNATEFLSPKVQAKWESLYPGTCACNVDSTRPLKRK